MHLATNTGMYQYSTSTCKQVNEQLGSVVAKVTIESELKKRIIVGPEGPRELH